MSTAVNTARELAAIAGRTLAVKQARMTIAARQRLAVVNVEEGRRLVAAALAEHANAAIQHWLGKVYDREGTVWYNVTQEGRITLPAPWSRRRCTEYGFSEPQSRILLRITVDLVGALHHDERLYWFDDTARRYYLNRQRFPNLDRALLWQERHGQITPAKWRAYEINYPGGRL